MGKILIVLSIALTAVHSCGAAEPQPPVENPAGIAFFEAKIRPVLAEHCYSCHSAKEDMAEGSLRLDTRGAVLAGGDRGPAIVAGEPEKSLLLIAMSHADPDLRMPPKEERLPASVIADFEKWIRIGAPDPRESPVVDPTSKWKDADAAKNHWAYQPVIDPAVPTIQPGDWQRQDLDAFVLKTLQENELSPSPEAEPHVLLRRLHFDLVGLPPTPEEIHAFLDQVAHIGLDAAVGEVVDKLLASPAFGERWGRHWLDVARFAESSGGEANISFPDAWRYRDYVIDCFNVDLRFDRFLIEQIAGDLLPAQNDAERARLLIATGFLAVGPKNLDAANEKQFYADLIDEQIDTVTRSVLANSVACARCHDHKFDPFSMSDYYALAGIFGSTKTFFGTAVSPSNRLGGDPLPLPRLPDEQIFHASIAAKQVADLEAELKTLRDEEREKKAAFWKAALEGKDASGIFTIQDALRILWRTGAIEGQLEKVDEEGKAIPLAMGALNREEPHDAPLLEKGDILRPGEAVPRRFPDSIPVQDSPTVPADESGRLELAHWLTASTNPLASRVIVNRVWHHLFGAGIVRTVDNFGTTGELPSHPELLDHLASRFIQGGWSIKRLIRDIVTSRTYRQSSAYNDVAFQRDPENRFLWRASKRRLEAEAIRDAVLAASGDINLARPAGSLVARTIGDRPISLIGLDKRLPQDLDGSQNRSVYLPVIRDRLPDVLEHFDFAETSMVTGSRETTNVPTQSLYLMNSPWVQARSDAMAARLMREAENEDDRIERAFLLCFGRHPDSTEVLRSREYLQQERAVADSEQMVFARFSQALLSTAEFRNLD